MLEEEALAEELAETMEEVLSGEKPAENRRCRLCKSVFDSFVSY